MCRQNSYSQRSNYDVLYLKATWTSLRPTYVTSITLHKSNLRWKERYFSFSSLVLLNLRKYNASRMKLQNCSKELKKYNDDALKKEEERRNKEQTRNQSRTKLTFYFPTLPNFSLFALLSRVAFVGKVFFFALKKLNVASCHRRTVVCLSYFSANIIETRASLTRFPSSFASCKCTEWNILEIFQETAERKLRIRGLA